MHQTKIEKRDVWFVDDHIENASPNIAKKEMDDLVIGYRKIKSARIRQEVLALISELTRETRK